MSSHGVTGFRLFYNEVVGDVRAELLARLGSETVPLADVQREVARLWKECPHQEEYRKKAAAIAPANGAADAQGKPEPGDIVIPPHRLKRILELDDEAPRMTKDASRTLGQATFAGHVDKHIVDTGASYPVKPEHIASVINNPLYPKYQFLAGSEEQLFNSTATHPKDRPSAASERAPTESEADKPNSELTESPGKLADNSESTLPERPVAPQQPVKARQPSILSYFGGGRAAK
ncbi:hypothetical protein, conserved [Babesia bigemina]|uniref:Uncharacterized protein n=1 Tax=Babesia bigemina TaxID=5866 RepID=A0A061D6H3_BABBI|nr:hypothetical protein, conserved [Babesia bigemina]CDR95617.1 hypothetical protein, conserved [Babesia bigemina]|eukprot:XP_012767803.1 hypothetical protein, conserved [Babesia bigemina]